MAIIFQEEDDDGYRGNKNQISTEQLWKLRRLLQINKESVQATAHLHQGKEKEPSVAYLDMNSGGFQVW